MEEQKWNENGIERKIRDKWEKELNLIALKELTIIYGMF